MRKIEKLQSKNVYKSKTSSKKDFIEGEKRYAQSVNQCGGEKNLRKLYKDALDAKIKQTIKDTAINAENIAKTIEKFF